MPKSWRSKRLLILGLVAILLSPMSTSIPTNIGIGAMASQRRDFFSLASAFAKDSALLILLLLEDFDILEFFGNFAVV
jgi:hypothetical protein